MATLSLDLDDAWAYLRAHGDPGWQDAPTVLPLAIDRLAPLLDELGLRVTVFVVGRDAETPWGREVVRALADAGHEVASHSFLHRGELPFLPADQLADDLDRTGEALTAAAGRPPTGFRCPSYGRSPALVEALLSRGYTYDASVLPTVLAPLLRLYHRLTMSAAARRATADVQLFGPAANALLPLTPFRWSTGESELLELPVTTVPLLRVPMHASYVQALAAHSEPVADAYLGAGLRACRARGVAPSFLLHPPDVLDARDAPGLSYLPGMARDWRRKVEGLRRALTLLAEGFAVVPLERAAQALADLPLPVRRLEPVRTRREPVGAR